jgi:hypothetical protein
VAAPARGVAGEVEPAPDPRDPLLRGEAPADRGEPLRDRVDDALTEGSLEFAVAQIPTGPLERLHRGERACHAAFGSALEHATRGDREHDRQEDQAEPGGQLYRHLTPRP